MFTAAAAAALGCGSMFTAAAAAALGCWSMFTAAARRDFLRFERRLTKAKEKAKAKA